MVADVGAMTTPDAMLRETFGHDTFRPGQLDVINTLLAGRSALAVFPTGAGKSLCYQLPALMLDGLTVVVSPLIALMKDQVDDLTGRGIAAARLDSTLDADQAKETYRRLDPQTPANERIRILYVAPERLGNERFIARLRRLRIALMAVDEAHCISEWGHNFRPDYLKLAELASALDVERVLALTATATPKVSSDVLQAFHIAPGDHVQTGFHRPNLTIRMIATTGRERPQLLLHRLREAGRGPTIIYVTLQRTAEDVAEMLRKEGFAARAYHAGLGDEPRAAVQDAFMADEIDIVVATIAFGMGIDKPDIRAVFHYNLPKTLENYTQEIGRAGRDGRPSICELLAAHDDTIALENFTYGDTPTPEAINALVDFLLSQGTAFDVSRYDLSQTFDVRPLVVATALTYLELDGILRATGPFYGGYKVAIAASLEAVLGAFDADRADFLRRVFAASKKGRTWYTIDLAEVANTIGEARDRVARALDYLEDKGHITTKPTGLRHGYRVIDPSADASTLGPELYGRFQARERRDVERVAEIVAFAEHDGCLVRRLLNHFGEDLPANCGECTSCIERAPRKLTCTPPPPMTGEHAAMVRALTNERHDALAHPRQIARFLAGLTSPKASRARLTRDPRFGQLRHVPFSRVLDLVMSSSP